MGAIKQHKSKMDEGDSVTFIFKTRDIWRKFIVSVLYRGERDTNVEDELMRQACSFGCTVGYGHVLELRTATHELTFSFKTANLASGFTKEARKLMKPYAQSKVVRV